MALKLSYKKNNLHLGEFDLRKITTKYKTPFYLYSEENLLENFSSFKAQAEKVCGESMICFALKANPNRELLKILQKLGAGADIVSLGELKRALEAGIPPAKIIFSGVGKTEEEILFALKKNIFSFNVESIEELALINKLAKKIKTRAKISFRLNPKVKALTHKHISTGFKTHKFGILKQDIIKAMKDKSLWTHADLQGLSIHIGSQLLDLQATKEAVQVMCKTALKIGHEIKFLDFGGGLGVSYNDKYEKAPTLQEYMNLIDSTVKKILPYNVQYVFEPGRRIIATSGFFITKVLRNKLSEGNHFTIVDGGMNDFVRPSLYDAYHEIYPSKNIGKKIKTDIVGPICETSDCFAHKRPLHQLEAGDFIVIRDTGAYGHSMSSHYNLRSRPGEYLLTKNKKIKKINIIEKLESLL